MPTSFHWEQLARLTAGNEPQRDALLVQLLYPDDVSAALPWMLQGMARAATWRKSPNREDRMELWSFWTCAVRLLTTALEQLQTITQVAVDAETIMVVTTHLREGIEELEQEVKDGGWKEDKEEREQTLRERRELVSELTLLAQRQG